MMHIWKGRALMNEIDEMIIRLLGKNARMTASDIGKKIKLSVPAVAQRIRKLEEKGIVKGYGAVLERRKIGKGLLTFILVDVKGTENIPDFRGKMLSFNEVVECHHVAGEYDYLLKVAVSDTSELEDFIMGKLKKIPGVANSRTFIVFSSIKEDINGGEYS